MIAHRRYLSLEFEQAITDEKLRASIRSLVHFMLVYLKRNQQQRHMTSTKITEYVHSIQLSAMRTHHLRARLKTFMQCLVGSALANPSHGVIYGICVMLKIDESDV